MKKLFKRISLRMYKRGATWGVIFENSAVALYIAYTVPILLLDSLVSHYWRGYSDCIYSFCIKLICLAWIVFILLAIPHGRKEYERCTEENKRKKGGGK